MLASADIGAIPATQAGPLLHLDRSIFVEKFDRVHFQVQHRLHEERLFELPRLIELARDTATRRPQDLYYDAGDVAIGQRWNEAPKSAFPVDETIRRIEQAGAWIILKQAQKDPAYDALLQRCMSELLRLSDRELERQIKSREVIVFITSPNRITSYHIDTECNFLLQIRGEKQISVFDRTDRDVLTEQELERFWSVDTNAAVYKPQFQDRAATWTLRPGDGVHIPVNCPHWLRNANNVSVSVSINFRYVEGVRGDLYRANHVLRRLGMRPRPPFASPAIDWLKRPLGAGARHVRRLRRGRDVD